MLALTIFLTCVLIVCGVGALAAWSDVRGLTIPNIYSLIVVLAYLACFAVVSFVDISGVLPTAISSIVAAGIFFVVTFIMFSLNILGAADSKLGTAYAFWVGFKGLWVFLFYMTLFGGLLAVVSLLLKKYKPFKSPQEGGWVQVVQDGHSKIPYGVAIFVGVLASFNKLGYFNIDTLRSFLAG